MIDASPLNTRLALLPRKVGLPFRELLAAEQLSEDDVSVILDAGELAGDPHRLLAFAIGYLSLRSQAVPVHDVIRMAKAQNRRVNLGWSAKRWKSEHDRLSRAQALDALARENVTYDVAKVAQHLPAKFPGYLIRTSRRLGMEGLRQRHCVASYHDRLISGSCAIASVFVDGKRWTVELATTGDLVVPLRIVQIKTRFNGMPTNDVHERIHALLGIPAFVQPQHVSAGRPRDYAYMENLRLLLPILRHHGVERVAVSFDGCGDSGSIDNVDYTAPDRFAPGAVTVAYDVVSSAFEDGRWVRTVQREQSSLSDAIESLTNDYLDETGVDWYNNDGGYGELVIDVERETVYLDVNVRFTDSRNEFSCERDIVTGEEV